MVDANVDVFVNCPFDSAYESFFYAILFTVADCGFRPRTAREIDDAGETRIAKLYRIIGECPYGIHDISRIELDRKSGMPRFNMPLELGIYLGARHFGSEEDANKKCLVLDRSPYRYQKFCSDIAGQDIKSHSGRRNKLITVVRDWLRNWSPPGERLPGGDAMAARYNAFNRALPAICSQRKLNPKKLHYLDHLTLITAWLRENP